MSKINIIILSFLIKVMAATETPSEFPTVESLTGRASGVPTPEIPTVESLGLRVALSQTEKEQDIRRKAANTLLEIYYHLNRAGTFSTGAFDLEIPGNWDLIHTHYGHFLVPKIDCSIDDALNDIRTATEGTIFAECTNAALIAKMALTNCLIEPAKKNVYNSKAFLQQHMSSLDSVVTRH